MSEALLQTPLYDEHLALHGKMVPFAGWNMPVQYSGILSECSAVRNAVGIFDISHMARLFVSGPGAEAFLSHWTSNDVKGLRPGKAHYSLVTNPDGGIMDDIIIYRLATDRFLVVVNAGNSDKILPYFASKANSGVAFDNQTKSTAMIAIQGPNAPKLVENVIGQDLSGVGRFEFNEAAWKGTTVILCRTGYTGEDGFEVILPSNNAPDFWKNCLENGAIPCGLGSRDALRIEVGYPLYGHEITETTTPVEAGLMWAVKLDKGTIQGERVIREAKGNGPKRKLVGIKLSEKIIPRQGYNLYDQEIVVGEVTSGIFSPTTGYSIGMAYVDVAYSATGTGLQLDIRNKRFDVTVVPKKDLLK